MVLYLHSRGPKIPLSILSMQSEGIPVLWTVRPLVSMIVVENAVIMWLVIEIDRGIGHELLVSLFCKLDLFYSIT